MFRVLLSGAVAAGLMIVGAPSAYAATDDLTELARYNSGISLADLDASVQAAVKATGESRATVIATALAEAEASAAEAASGLRPTSSDGEGDVKVTLRKAKSVGDVFVSPSSTYGYEHGHVGIYYTRKVIVEAPGQDKKSRSISANKRKVGVGTQKQHVSVSKAKRKKAAVYAYKKLRGKPYNTNFAFNRDAYGEYMNCSQLVWAAYTIKAGVDLDSNGGFGVYPYNIRDSALTKTYKTLS